MRRAALVWPLLLVVLAWPAFVWAQGVAEISSPRANAVVRGNVSVQGTASHPDFWKYEVWIAPGLSPRDDQWFVIDLREQQIPGGGQLTLWNTLAVPDGVYSLRLRVVRTDGNYDERVVQPINVANAEPPTQPPPPPPPPPPPSPTEPPPPPPTETRFVPTATPQNFATWTPTPLPGPSGTPTVIQTLGPNEVPTVGAVGTGSPTVVPGATLAPSASQTPLPTFTPIILIETPISEGNDTAAATITPVAIARRPQGGSSDGSSFLPEGMNITLGLQSDDLSSACVVGMGFTVGIFLLVAVLALLRSVIRLIL